MHLATLTAVAIPCIMVEHSERIIITRVTGSIKSVGAIIANIESPSMNASNLNAKIVELT